MFLHAIVNNVDGVAVAVAAVLYRQKCVPHNRTMCIVQKFKYGHAHHFDYTDVWCVTHLFFYVCGQLHHFFGISSKGWNKKKRLMNERLALFVVRLSFLCTSTKVFIAVEIKKRTQMQKD